MERTIISHWIGISALDGRFVVDPWATRPDEWHSIPYRALAEACSFRLSLSVRRMLQVGEIHDHYIRVRSPGPRHWPGSGGCHVQVVVIRYRCLTRESENVAGVYSKLYFSSCDRIQYIPLSPAPLPQDIGNLARTVEMDGVRRGFGVAAQYEITSPPPWRQQEGRPMAREPEDRDVRVGLVEGMADDESPPDMTEDSDGEINLVSRTLIRLTAPAPETGDDAPPSADA